MIANPAVRCSGRRLSQLRVQHHLLATSVREVDSGTGLDISGLPWQQPAYDIALHARQVNYLRSFQPEIPGQTACWLQAGAIDVHDQSALPNCRDNLERGCMLRCPAGVALLPRRHTCPRLCCATFRVPRAPCAGLRCECTDENNDVVSHKKIEAGPRIPQNGRQDVDRHPKGLWL